MGTADSRPPLSEAGHVVVASAYFPPQVTGSSVLMYNLLSHFHPDSYSVATAESPHSHSLERRMECDCRVIMSSVRFSWRVKEWWRLRQIPLATRRLVRLLKEKDAKLLIGVYPDYHFLKAARDAARTTGTPWVSYMHDTLAESHTNRPLEQKAKVLQNEVFSEASRVLVMSQGMADLYKKKYSLEAFPIVHTYPEEIQVAPQQETREKQGFWSGTIYRINQHAFSRVASAFGQADVNLVVATNKTRAQLEQVGASGRHIETTFFAERPKYLAALTQQSILVQALDWPDESPIHEDELSTIFPTKTPEYLAAGVPMLVHCPEHYFLARFVQEHGCGLVVSTRSDDSLLDAISKLLAGDSEVEIMREKALQAAHIFSASAVTAEFKSIADSIVKVSI